MLLYILVYIYSSLNNLCKLCFTLPVLFFVLFCKLSTLMRSHFSEKRENDLQWLGCFLQPVNVEIHVRKWKFWFLNTENNATNIFKKRFNEVGRFKNPEIVKYLKPNFNEFDIFRPKKYTKSFVIFSFLCCQQVWT